MGIEINPKKDDLSPSSTSSILLELAASDDVESFKIAIEKGGYPIDQMGLWYTRRIGSNKMSYERRTPLMVAAQYGSVKVVDYIIRSGDFDVNRVAGSDRVTALHCAVAGGSDSSLYVVKLLMSASADVNILDGRGNRASDLIPNLPKLPFKNRHLDTLLKPGDYSDSSSGSDSDTDSKKEYPVAELPDINNGVYSTDEFRMYCFKVTPCSRAYTHDWTECPFAHPGENAKRRDPKKYPYTCVPCPEFKKGGCKKGDDCEFAHGVFESWLHPAQYRTRLCKDETGCARKVCFFAHKKEELRPVYASTGSALPGPDLSLTPPLSPSFSPKSGKSNLRVSVPPPKLQLHGSRLRSSLSARDVEFERELRLNHQTHYHHQQQQQQQQQILSPKWSQSVAAVMLNSRAAAAAAFAKRSQSFIMERSSPSSPMAGNLSSSISSNWGSPNRKLDWGVQGEELNKLRKSNSFGFRGSSNNPMRTSPPGFDEPDVSWVNSLVKDEGGAGFLGSRAMPNYGHGGGGGGGGNGVQVQDMRSPWMEQLYIEQEQLVA